MKDFLFTNRRAYGIAYNGRTILAMIVLVLVAIALPISFLCAQTTVTTDQGTSVILTKTMLEGNTLKPAPKDSVYYIKDAVPAMKNGQPLKYDLKGQLRQVYQEIKSGTEGTSARFFVVRPTKSGWGRLYIQSMLPFMFRPDWSDTLKLFMEYRNGETFLLFFYDPATQVVMARTPLAGELVDYGKSSYRKRSSTYHPEILCHYGAITEQYEDGIPTMWWCFTQNTITGDISARLWVPEFDASWSFGNFADIKVAVSEDIVTQQAINRWETRKGSHE